MSGSAGMTKVEIDTSTIANGDSIAAYVTDSAGALVTSTLLSGKQRLDVINPSEYAEDSVHSSGDYMTFAGGIRMDADTSPVSADGDYHPFVFDNEGRLKVDAELNADFDYVYAEDSGHLTGDLGSFSLNVRNDDQGTTATSANADYSYAAVDDRGAMFVKDTAARANLQQIVTVGTTAVALPAAPLSKRSSMFVQMLSSGQLYLGSATVTNAGATRGFLLGNGDFVNVDVGPGNLVYGVASAAGKDVMVWEFS